ncbi:permease [Vibrio sp. ER1A]|uniref:permease n=1 Tax=Vibrio sp. ER1A TaxID=1517681 RepID=UPI0013626812|nr:permease [Vibrio sp. ER1A]
MNIVLTILQSIATMIWSVAWALCLGFLLSATIQTLVSTKKVQSKLGITNARSLGLATFFGAVSSSCSYAAASMSKSLFQKGASLPVSSAFLVSSTNLVLEIMFVIWILMGWQFVVGELLGGILLVLLLAMILPIFVKTKTINRMRTSLESKEQNNATTTEGNCNVHMKHSDSHSSDGINQIHTNSTAITRICQSFRMELGMVGKDILIGLVIAAVLAVVIPASWWATLFMTPDDITHPSWLVLLWNAIIGPIIAILAFVCSVGNIVLASVLWAGGISFGGVMAFILADIITLPMIKQYANYYGWAAAIRYSSVLFFCIVLTALMLDLIFLQADMMPKGPRNAHIAKMEIQWNYTSFLNLLFIPVALWAWVKGKMDMH